jgi:predicted transcriptional regulator
MAREKRDATKVSYMIDNELLNQLENFCERTGRTKTKVIEIALRQFLDKHKEQE